MARLADFYKSRTVFLTGATGCVGLLVVEKLLRTTQVERIYALVRAPDQPKAQARLHQSWDRHLSFASEAMKSSGRVVALPGDIALPNMGLVPADQIRVRREASVVIHLASDIALLKSAVELANANIFGLLELADFASTFRNLTRFVYVSSFFSQICYPRVDEEPVLSDTTERELACLRNRVEPFDIKQTFLIDYLYTKHLAERVLSIRYPNLPLTIFRPSCIGPAHSEPMPMWTYVQSMPVMNYHRMALRKPKDEPMVHKSLEYPANGDNLFDEVPIDYVVHSLLAHCAAGTGGAVNCNSGYLNPAPASAQFKYTKDLIPPQRFATITWEETRGPCRIFKLTGLPCPVGTNDKTLALRANMSAADRQDFKLDLEQWDMDLWQRRRAAYIRLMAAATAATASSTQSQVAAAAQLPARAVGAVYATAKL